MTDQPPKPHQRIQFVEDNSCISSAVRGVAIVVNIIVVALGGVLIYRNWDLLFSDPIVGFLAVIFLYLYTRDISR